MQKRFTAIILLLFTMLWACHKKEMGKTNITSVPKTEVSASDVTIESKKIIIDKMLDVQKLGGSATKIDSLGINGNILSIFVNYGGGCKEHIFELYFDGTYAKSIPSMAFLYLKHINNNDACRKLVMRELKFDISAIKLKGSLTIKVADQSIIYKSK